MVLFVLIHTSSEYPAVYDVALVAIVVLHVKSVVSVFNLDLYLFSYYFWYLYLIDLLKYCANQ